MPYVKANKLKIFYKEQGKGEPLILLHGGALSQASWEQHIQILKKSFRVITPDSRGHGNTNNPYQEITYRAMADDLKSFIDALRLEKPHICGFSDGCHIALELAMNYPESLVTLMVSGVHIRFSEPMLKFIREMGVLGPGKVDTWATVANSSEWFMNNLRIHHAPDSDYWKTLLYQLSFQWFSSPDYSEADFKRVVTPALVMFGDRDESTPIEQAVEMYCSIPDAELFVAPGCSHVYPLTKPEFFCKVISEFIQRRRS